MTSHSPDSDLDTIESRRLQLQADLDAQRSAAERNKSGQFATPATLARDIVEYALSLHGDREIHFLEPSCGSGSFYSALLRTLRTDHIIADATGIELDPRFVAVARDLWGRAGLTVVQGDFLDPATRPRGSSSLLIANPPYVRHHHLDGDAKVRAMAMSQAETGIKPSGLSGLYLYFVLLSHQTLRPGAISAWLIPAEFMDVNYGRALKEYLTRHVTLKRIHRFDPADLQFDDALVTSAVVVFENTLPEADSIVEFTYGGPVSAPRDRHLFRNDDLKVPAKWSALYRADSSGQSGPRLGDFFTIRRGIATGSNKFFVMTLAEAQSHGFRAENLTPLLPSPRHIKGDVIEVAENGYPDTNPQLVLINARQRIDQLSQSDPALAEYLGTVTEDILSGYLVRQRDPWYRQEQREAAPYVLTYMGRGVEQERPFRFILNRSKAIVTNMYLMLYPTSRLQAYLDADPEGLKKVHAALLSLTGDDLRHGGRVYGGGLHKMEPKELAALDASAIAELSRGLWDDVEAAPPLPFDLP